MLYQLSYLGIRGRRSRRPGGYRKGGGRSSRPVRFQRVGRRRRVVVLLGRWAWHDVMPGKPAAEIDLGAARAAERDAGRGGRSVADRAARGRSGAGSGTGGAGSGFLVTWDGRHRDTRGVASGWWFGRHGLAIVASGRGDRLDRRVLRRTDGQETRYSDSRAPVRCALPYDEARTPRQVRRQKNFFSPDERR